MIMSEAVRPSPKGKPVSLFVTCIVDNIFPQAGISVVEILEHLGVEVRFPQAQTCCGQPAFNAGFQDDARQVAKQFVTAFADAEVIVTPSGSCGSMVCHYYLELFKDDPEWRTKAQRIVDNTWEFTEYLVDGLGVADIGAKLPPTKVCFHHACHGYRLMHLGTQAQALAGAVQGVTLTELKGADQCCGFGGLFSVKMADISGAMLNDKVANINAADADVIVTGDASCMMQMNGGLSRQDSPRRVMHIAEFLAKGLK
jgi:L-lactate dehydrogenase complex protein LldE